MYQIQKKDGNLEAFDRNKIIGGLMKSGASAEEAQQVASEVEAWLPQVAVDNVVKGLDIRSKVLEALKVANPTVAAGFESYQKPAQPA